MNLIKKTVSILSICVFSLALALPVSAKVEGDTIILGAAVSLSGKYSTNGEHTRNGYNMAVQRIATNILKTPLTIASIGPIKKLEFLDKIHNRLN